MNKLEFSIISWNILIFGNTCAANTVRPFETFSKKVFFEEYETRENVIVLGWYTSELKQQRIIKCKQN